MATMYYAGTHDEIRLGDRVRIHRWLRPDLEGTVSHIPGVSPKDHELDSDGVRCWAITCDRGRVWRMPYVPDHFTGQPPKSIELLDRGQPASPDPDSGTWH